MKQLLCLWYKRGRNTRRPRSRFVDKVIPKMGLKRQRFKTKAITMIILTQKDSKIWSHTNPRLRMQGFLECGQRKVMLETVMSRHRKDYL